MKRIYESLLSEHHKENRQMALIAGPRQVGKTTSCKNTFKDCSYLNWDNINDRMLFTKGPNVLAEHIGLFHIRKTKLPIIFDEIHKFSKWKSFLKGFFDTYNEKSLITVTGSAKLNVYKRGGDSLMGRYFFYRMHPVSVAEILYPKLTDKEIKLPNKIDKTTFSDLLTFGGFPESLIKANSRFTNRWRKLREELLFKEDAREITHITEIGQLQILAELLKTRSGQLINYSNLSQIVNTSVNTIRNWILSLQMLYYCFEVRPWYNNISKSLRKQPKIYLWDWSAISDIGMKYENFVASHLLKAVHWWTDIGLGEYNLYYLRDKEQREVDFLVTRNNKPWFLVEVKSSKNNSLSKSLFYYQKQTKTQHSFQLVFDMDYIDADCFKESKPIIVPAQTFLSQLI